MIENIWDLINALVAVAALALSIGVAISRSKKASLAEVKDDSDTQSEMQMKIKELEGRMAGNYAELTAKLISLERTIADTKYSNSAFETRLISDVNKIENRLERLSDLLIKQLTNKTE